MLQKHKQFRELTELQAIGEGGFGVIYRAKHRDWGTVVYKELKLSVISDGSRFENHSSDTFPSCLLDRKLLSID